MKVQIDEKLQRNVAGGFATGITIVTTEDENENPVGMTVSSFVCISLDPPLVGFFVKEAAEFMTQLKSGKPIAISILTEDQRNISNQFAGLNEEEIHIDYDVNKPYHKIANALAWYETKVESIQPAGDHFMIMCDVLDLKRDSEKKPLLYYSGYRSIGDNIQ